MAIFVCYYLLMEIEALQQRITETQNKFDETTKNRDTLNEELVRLQGEYRAYSDLLKQLEDKKDAASKPAVVKKNN